VGNGVTDAEDLFIPSRWLHAWWLRIVASPRRVMLTRGDLDQSTVQDLALVQMSELQLPSCRLTPSVIIKLCGIHSIRRLQLSHSEVTDEGLNIVWSHLPELEEIFVNSDSLSDEGFREIKNARHLKKLTVWGAPKMTGQVIARMCDAPALKVLELDQVPTSDAAALRLAGKPGLREINWEWTAPDASFVTRLKAINPHLKLRLLLPDKMDL
jgi:hypothetical protein